MAGPAKDDDEFAAYREQRRGNGQSQDPAQVDEFSAYQEARGRKKGGSRTSKQTTRGQAASLGLDQGQTFGLADEAAGMKAMLGLPAVPSAGPTGMLTDAVFGLGGLAVERFGKKKLSTSDLITGENSGLPESYTVARDARRFVGDVARQDHPVTSFTSEVAGSAVYPGGALKVGAPLLGQTTKLGLIGAGQGAVYGYASSDGDTQDREDSAKVGAVFGGVGGAILPSAAAAALPVFRAGKTGVAEFADWLVGKFGGTGTAAQGNAEQVAKAAVLRSMERSGMTPEKVMEAIQKFGDKPAVLAEVIGQDAVNALTSLTRRPGSTPQKAQAMIEERFGGFVDRAQGDLEKATGFSRSNIEGDFNAELSARQEAASPVYTDVYEQFPQIQSQKLQALAASPTLKKYMASAQAGLADEAATVGKRPDQMSQLQFWDLVKRDLDDAIDKAEANGAAEELRRLSILKTQVVTELDAVTGGAYAKARELGGEAPRLKQAFKDGGRAMGSANTADIERQVNALNPQDQPFYKAGMTSNISTRLDKGLTPQRFRVRDTQGKVKAGLGEEEGGSFLNAMEAEASLRETGSRWAPRMNSVTGTVLEGGPSQAVDDAISGGAALLRGDKIGALRTLINVMRRRGYNQKQIDAMGDLLLSNPADGLKQLGIKLPSGGAPPPASGGQSVGRGFVPSMSTPANQPANALSGVRSNESGMVEYPVANALLGGSGGATYGSFNDVNQDGKQNWEDQVGGAMIGVAGMYGLQKGGDAIAPMLPRSGYDRMWKAPDLPAFVNEQIRQVFKPQKVTRAADEADWYDALGQASDVMRRFENPNPDDLIHSSKMPDDTARDIVIFAQEELAAAILKSKGIDPDPVYSRMLKDRPTIAETRDMGKIMGHYAGEAKAGARAAEADEIDPQESVIDYLDSLAPDKTRLNGFSIPTSVGDAVVSGAVGSGTGSVMGMQYDLNGDGKIDDTDKMIGAAGGMALFMGGPRAYGAAKNALSGISPAGFGAGGKKPPKPDSPEAIAAAVKGIATKKTPEPTRLERMVEEGKNASVPPINTLPHQADALGAQAERMAARGLSPIEIYDQTGVAMIPYNGGSVPIVSPAMGPEELTRKFYGWLAQPPAKRPDWVKDIISKAPRKKGLMLTEKAPAPVQTNALAEQPLPKAGFPYGGVAVGTLAGAATGIPAGALAGYTMTRDQNRPRNALSGQ